MTTVIQSYESIGPLNFGMNQNDVVVTMGEPQRITKSRSGNHILWYNDGELNVTLENDSLVEVGFGPKAQVSIRGVNPFTEPGAFAKLCELDGNPHEILGFIVLQNLGITFTGFHDHDESQKAVTTFIRGRWDAMESQMKPFSL